MDAKRIKETHRYLLNIARTNSLMFDTAVIQRLSDGRNIYNEGVWVCRSTRLVLGAKWINHKWVEVDKKHSSLVVFELERNPVIKN